MLGTRLTAEKVQRSVWMAAAEEPEYAEVVEAAEVVCVEVALVAEQTMTVQSGREPFGEHKHRFL